MTGIGWLDALSVVAFGTVTGLALVRLARDRTRGLQRFLDDGFHAVMGVAMTAMFWPGSGRSAAVWVAMGGLVLVWPLLVLTLATRRSADRTSGDQASGDRVPGDRASGGPVSLGHAGYWLTCALLMVVAVGSGHGSATAAGSSGGMATSMTAMPGATHPAAAGIGTSALGNAFQMATAWPIWPLVGLGFAVYAGLILLSRRRPITERTCAAVMAAGMAVMALSL